VAYEREAQSNIVATTETGETIEIPSRSRLQFAADGKDWRRVAVYWKGKTLLISRTAWESSVEVQ
jgi:hypothetical protein